MIEEMSPPFHMKLAISDELLDLLRNIVRQGLQLHEWASIESCDMFQSPNFVGGFDATEMEFCFSYFDPNGCEFWFQLPLDRIHALVKGEEGEVEVRKADL